MATRTVLICGDRNWYDRKTITSWIAKLQDYGYDAIVEGEARGADRIAPHEARLAGMEVIAMPADWEKYGRAAGPIRNQEMLDIGAPSLVVFFHNDLSRSKGTADMVRRAERQGIPVINGVTNIPA